MTRQAALQRRYRQAGRCVCCGDYSAGMALCPKHRLAQNARAKAYYRRNRLARLAYAAKKRKERYERKMAID